MVRKRIKSKPIQLGQKEKEEIDYMKQCEIAKACDNLPPLKRSLNGSM